MLYCYIRVQLDKLCLKLAIFAGLRGMTMSDKTIQNTTVGTVQPGALTAIARKEDFLQHLQDFLDTHKTEK